MAAHLLILGDRDALRWVLRNERMAFEVHRKNDVARLAVGDTLLIYTTRGCFHNPTRDRGRVIGRAVVTARVEPLEESVVVMDREFGLGCTFDLVLLPLDTKASYSLISSRSSTPFPSRVRGARACDAHS